MIHLSFEGDVVRYINTNFFNHIYYGGVLGFDMVFKMSSTIRLDKSLTQTQFIITGKQEQLAVA